MGDKLSVVLLGVLIGFLALILLISLILVKKVNQAATKTTPIDTTPQENAELLAKISDLEQRLSLMQQENAGLLNHRLSALDTKVAAVDSSMHELHRLFRNVKLRGGWGEIQLGAILHEFLTPNQYDTNVTIDPESAERVEFALKLPLVDNTYLWLPIDAKCPIEDFERYQQALEINDTAEAEKCRRALARRLSDEARDIAEKYIHPPYSTDFALLFLPIEGIYQWVLGEAGLQQELERKYRVILTSPATLTAVLNLVQLSHRSLAISQSESEVWRYLNSVKQEMSNFDEAITKTQKKAQEMTNTLDNLAKRQRVLERRLAEVEAPSENIAE